jgi:hypothetical protein
MSAKAEVASRAEAWIETQFSRWLGAAKTVKSWEGESGKGARYDSFQIQDVVSG